MGQADSDRKIGAPILLAVCTVVLLLFCIWIDGSSRPDPSIATFRPNEVTVCKRLAVKYHAEVEYRLPDGKRVDLLTPEYAIEAEWPTKWYESIGQSLYYAIKTSRKPAIILLRRDMRDDRDINDCREVCKRYDITLFVEEVRDE